MLQTDNTFAYLGSFSRGLNATGFPYVSVGGLATAILLNPGTTFDLRHRLVRADQASFLPMQRLNGTPRDNDFFLFTAAPGATEQAFRQASEVMRREHPEFQPELSISAYEQPVKALPWIQLISRKVMEGNERYLQVGHVLEEIPVGVQEEPWRICFRDETLPMHHPILHLHNYVIRSIAGLRPKDADKVGKLSARLADTMPAVEWSRFSSWKRFESRVRDEVTLSQAMSKVSLRRLSLALSKLGVAAAERSELLVWLSQQPNGRRAITRLLRSHCPSQVEYYSPAL